MRVKVNKLSIRPIPARVREKGKTIYKVSRLYGTVGMLNSGKPPDTEAKSPTVGVSILRAVSYTHLTLPTKRIV